MDLYEELQIKTKELDISIKSLRHTGADYAESYKRYRVELAKELLRLRNEGIPATLAYDIARGKEDIADLKKQEIEKEAIYKANQEAINSIKLQIRIIESQLNREWNNTKE